MLYSVDNSNNFFLLHLNFTLPFFILQQRCHQTLLCCNSHECLYILSQASEQSGRGQTLVTARLFQWPSETAGPRGGECSASAANQEPQEPNSNWAESQGGCRAGERTDHQGEPRSGGPAGGAGRLPGQAEGAGGRGGAAAASVASWLC